MKYVIIGSSAAGISAISEIRRLDKTGDIVLISKDKHIYSRCMLHHFISGDRSIEGLSFVDDNFIDKNNVEWIKGREVLKVIFNQKSVFLDDDTKIVYDKLLIATGAKGVLPPINNINKATNVTVLRDLDDAEKIKNINSNSNVLVIGAGLVGMDAAYGLVKKGCKVSIVEIGDRILPIQLDVLSAKVYEDEFIKRGAEVHKGQAVKEVLIDGDIAYCAILQDGTEIKFDYIVVAAGVKPRVEFLDDSIKIDMGIVVDDMMRTNIEDVFAAGDVTNIAPIWPIAVKQGLVAGHNMVRCEKYMDDVFGYRNSINFFGIDTISIGRINESGEDIRETVEISKGVYKKFVYKGEKLIGAIVQGDTEYIGKVTKVIKENISGLF